MSSDRFSTTLDSLAAGGGRVALWGFAREGRSLLRALRRSRPRGGVWVVDESGRAEGDPELARRPAAELVSPERVLASFGPGDAVVRSPGVRLYRPEFDRLRARGVELTSATELWLAAHAGARTVAITGTKGKSTAASLLAHMLRGVGLRVALGGNVGTPLFDLADTDPDVWVLEVSSFQAAGLRVGPEAAVLLNLHPEHLDWHGDVARYFADKLTLLRRARGPRFVNAIDVEGMRATQGLANRIRFGHAEGFAPDDRWLTRAGRRLPEVPGTILPGRVHRMNLCAALAVCEWLGLEADRCLAALEDFAPLPHRLSELGESAGVLFVDDSISTIPQSTLAALEVYRDRPVVLLAGGADRGVAFAPLASRLCEFDVRAVVAMPESGPRLGELVARESAAPPVVPAAGLAEAVARAVELAPPGAVVLLSPAAPSGPEFDDFAERGREFARLAGFETPAGSAIEGASARRRTPGPGD